MEIGAIITLVVAIISAIVALHSARKSRETELQLEALKDYRQERDVIRGMARQRADVLGRGSALVQHIRDDIRDLGRTPEGEDYSHLLANISRGCDAVVDLYANSHTLLPDQERRLMHDVKDRAKAILTACNKARDNPENIDALLAYSDSLTLLQSGIIAECEKWQEAAISGDE